MAEKVELLKLDLDIATLTDKAAEAFRDLSSLKTAQKELTKTASDLTKQMKAQEKAMQEAKDAGDPATYNEAKTALAALNKQYADVSKGIVSNNAEVSNASKEYANLNRLVQAYTEQQNATLGIVERTDGSINQLNAALAKNREIYRNLSAEQRDNAEIGGKLIDLINEQDQAYKDLQVSIGTTQVNVGNYEEAIKNATGSMQAFQGGTTNIITNFTSISQQEGGVKSFFSSFTKGIWGAVKGALAFIATPLGAVIAAVAVVVGLLIKAFSRSEATMNKFKTITGALSGVFGKLLDSVVPVVDFIANVAVKAFEGLGKLVEKTMGAVSKGLKFLGFDGAAASVGKFTASTKEAAKAGQELAKMQADQIVQERELKRIQFEYLKEQEQFRQVRDDVSKSTEERIKANDALGASLLKQTEVEMKVLKQALTIAQQRAKVDGETAENLDAIAEAKANIADLEERINGFQSEQLVNAVGLRKEAAEAAKAQAEKDVEGLNLKLQLLKAEKEGTQKTLEEKLKFAEQIYNEETAILNKQLKSGIISRQQFEVSVTELKRNYLKQQAELSIENAADELALYAATNRSKIEGETQLTQQLIAEEEARLRAIADKEIAILEQQRAANLISETDYNVGRIEANVAFLEQQKALQASYAKQQEETNKEVEAKRKEREQADFETSIELRKLRGENEFQIAIDEMERERLARIENARLTGENVAQLEAMFAARKLDLEKQQAEKEVMIAAEKEQAKFQSASDALGSVATLLGENTKAGKAAAAAQAIVNTYMGATAAFAQTPGGIVIKTLAAAAAVSSGLKSVQKILAVNPDVKAERGMVMDIGGKRHSAGGTKFFGSDGTRFEAEAGEKMFILNRTASKVLGPGLSRLNQMHGGRSLSEASSYLAAGGAVSRASDTVLNIPASEAIDYDLLANKIADAVSKLPAPVTKVTDIISGVDNYNRVVDGASF